MQIDTVLSEVPHPAVRPQVILGGASSLSMRYCIKRTLRSLRLLTHRMICSMSVCFVCRVRTTHNKPVETTKTAESCDDRDCTEAFRLPSVYATVKRASGRAASSTPASVDIDNDDTTQHARIPSERASISHHPTTNFS